MFGLIWLYRTARLLLVGGVIGEFAFSRGGDFAGTTLYTTLSPCAMCAGAIVLLLGTVVNAVVEDAVVGDAAVGDAVGTGNYNSPDLQDPNDETR